VIHAGDGPSLNKEPSLVLNPEIDIEDALGQICTLLRRQMVIEDNYQI
jgi:hypothetical protein